MSRRAITKPLLPLVLAGAVFWSPAQAQQRLSLADRVALLEQQANRPQQTVELLQQLNALRSELQALRGQLEELQNAHNQEMAEAKAREQVLEARLTRLEGASASSVVPPVATPPAVPPSSRPPAGRTAVPSPAATGDDKAAYGVAFDTLKAGQYAESARQFRAFLDAHPGSPLAGNALYWLGESYYVTQNYALAEEQFRDLLQRFPQHDKAPGALLKLGMTQMGLKQWDAAAASFREVQARYPGSDLARTADDRLRTVSALRPR